MLSFIEMIIMCHIMVCLTTNVNIKKNFAMNQMSANILWKIFQEKNHYFYEIIVLD